VNRKKRPCQEVFAVSYSAMRAAAVNAEHPARIGMPEACPQSTTLKTKNLVVLVIASG
jgi:hypothetical protein